MLLNCGVEKTESPLDSKEIKPVSPKGNQSWIIIEKTAAEAKVAILLAIWCEELTTGKDPNARPFPSIRGRLKAKREGGNRGWDGWMVSPTQWAWVWTSSRRWWRTGKPGMLQFMGLQRVGHNWATELWYRIIHNNMIIITVGRSCHKVYRKS